MTATIIPFPKKKKAGLTEPRLYSTEMLHLDLAAQWLKDRGWSADSGMLPLSGPESNLTIITDAPSDLISKAFETAHGYVCEFLIEEFNFADAELPTFAEFTPREIMSGLSGVLGVGHAFGHAQDFAN